jgi:hypothetical protein
MGVIQSARIYKNAIFLIDAVNELTVRILSNLRNILTSLHFELHPCGSL